MNLPLKTASLRRRIAAALAVPTPALGFLLSILGGPVHAPAATPQPNLVVIISDDQAWQDYNPWEQSDLAATQPQRLKDLAKALDKWWQPVATGSANR